MVKPGPRNALADVPGLFLGHAEDPTIRTGVTVILPREPAVIAGDVRGGAPGTRETDALSPTCLVERFHGLVLSGGSAFGLEAASGVTAALSDRGVGLPLDPRPVPVIPAAILYDLSNGGRKDWGDRPPYDRLGRAALAEALSAADGDIRADAAMDGMGNVGAGFGAVAGALKGGIGMASARFEDGATVAALVAINCFGSAVAENGAFWAGYLEQGEEFGGRGRLAPAPVTLAPDLPKMPLLGTNTTIGLVATDVTLDKAEATRLAIMAQDGLARAIRPIHTPFDGDSLFALSTCGRRATDPRPLLLTRIGAVAADCVARAVVRGILAAESLGDARSYRESLRR